MVHKEISIFEFFKIYFVLTYFQLVVFVRTYMAQGLVNETWTHLCLKLQTWVSSSLTEYPIKKALWHIFLSDESNKLETYTYVRTKNKFKNTNLLMGLPISKYFYSLFGPTTHTHTHTHTQSCFRRVNII